MKLNYRDKIILGALLAFVILLAGFFLAVKPKYNAIKTDSDALKKAQADKEDVDNKIAEIKPLQDEIKATYEATTKLTNDFVAYNDIYNARKLDQYMQHFAEDCEVKVTTLSASDLGESTLSYYYFTPSYVGESMLEAADLNGDRQAAIAEDKAESDALQGRTQESVLAGTYDINVLGTKENIYKYLQAIEDQDKTIIINTVDLGGMIINPEAFEKTADGLGNELSDEQKEMLEDDAEIEAKFNISVYSVFELSEPNVEAD
ncbi:MAG: hypothetical protein IKG98_04995 [Ruminococcus sp.]|nr:hypothetical protein [Ruminococcus sp.]